ncbi:hypothetical protein B0H13DRAFT_2468774 [Mycena leptocephala]|nr:hypothetical protein B0H13DRAFT_2468774 [Mycena leptocephala]
MLSYLSGRLKGWVREEPEGSVRTDLMQKNPLRYTTAPPQLSPPFATVPGAQLSHSDAPLADFLLSTWNGFPDGKFRCHFTRQQVEDTSRLALYWISDRLPGRRGLLDAATAEKGKLSRFRCAGVIDCRAVVCTTQIAPGPNVARQIEALCTCGSPLRHWSCTVEWSIVFYRDGAIFENSGTHNHSKYTHSLPASKNKKTLQLQEFISKQPIPLSTKINYKSDSSETGADESDCPTRQDNSSENDMNSEDEKALDPSAEEDENEM